MQTFLPYPDFRKSAQALDNKRLGKQRVEAFQILNTLQGKSSGWHNHPAVLMWKGYEDALEMYLRECILEWVRRGFKNTMVIPEPKEYKLPKWFGDSLLHMTHQSNLVRKDKEFYKVFDIGPELPYYWPTKGFDAWLLQLK